MELHKCPEMRAEVTPLRVRESVKRPKRAIPDGDPEGTIARPAPRNHVFLVEDVVRRISFMLL